MLPLIPLALNLLPEIGRWVFGERGASTAGAVADVVRAVTGTDDPAEARAKLDASPSMSEQVRIRLAEIAAKADEDARAAQLDAMRIAVADVANARSQTVELARAGSGVVWSAPLVSAIVLLAFAGVLALVLVRALPPGSETIVNMLLGTLAAMATQVVNYWLGSSAGSAAKNAALMAPGGGARP